MAKRKHYSRDFRGTLKARLLGVSVSTVKEDWRMARTWLYRELRAR